MAHFGKDLDNFSSSRTIKITGTETNENFTIYIIEVTVGHFTWTVKHRYSDFYELNEKLVSAAKIDKSLLPPKKLFGNQSEAFIRKRQNDLEVYLQTVLYFVAHKMPPCLAAFLNFDKYEIHGITQCMAEELYNKGDQWLQTRDKYEVTPLQLYSLTERLKLPEPTCEDSGDVKKDLGHILDFITRVKGLKVRGSKTPVGTSNIDLTQLKFDISLFKSLNCLELEYCVAANVLGIESAKESLERVAVNYGVRSIREVLLHDIPQWKAEDGTLLVSYWENLVEVDLSHNTIREIDDSVQIMPRVEVLDLSYNLLQSIQHLNWLSQLTHLDLSHNALSNLDALHTKLGNLKILNLAGNKLDSLQGLAKLFSLENLDVRENRISEIPEVKYVCNLPCIEFLYLNGNPVNSVLDYRTKVLEMCGERVIEVCLDGQKPTQKELDTVAVLQAIQKSKEKAKKPAQRKVSSSSPQIQSSPSSSHTQPSGLSWDSHSVIAQSSCVPSTSHTNNQTITQGYSHNGKDKSLEKSSHENIKEHKDSKSSDGEEPFVSRPQRQRFRTVSQDSQTNSSAISICALPDQQDKEFMTWLHTRLFGEMTEGMEVQENVVNVLWCTALQFSQPDSVVPCCVVLTERRVFVLRLKKGDSGYTGVPCLETFYILPLSNVQEIIIGPCYSYIRLEESFIGASGTFILMTYDSDVGKSFSDSLKSVYEGGDMGPSPIVNCSENSDLGKHIFSGEDEEGLCTGRIAFSMIVKIAGVDQQSLLILSENKVYLVHTDCLFWPRPAFLSQLEDIQRPNFSYLQQHSLMTKISDIKMSITLKASSRSKKVSSIESSGPSISFEQFGLSMVFHELIGPVGFHVWFLSVKSRDTFLDRLTTLRSEIAHRMSPTIREEPEGGNESTDSSDSSDGSHDANDEIAESQAVAADAETQSKNEESNVEDTEDVIKSKAVVKDRAATVAGFTMQVSKPEASLATSKTEDLMYLTKELEKQLQNCVQKYDLMKPLPVKLKALQELSGRQLAEYFHSDISMIGVDVEQLHYILWCIVVPYRDPKKEIVTCLMLSTRGIYFVSNQLVRSPMSDRQPWMTHTRNKSDSLLGVQNKTVDHHHISGILHSGHNRKTIIRSYHVCQYGDLQQINVGLFDQCIRLTGKDQNSVHTLLTRDSTVTEKLLHQVTTMLSIFTASPMLDKSSSDLEQDFYRAFDRRTKTTVDGIEYTHPSKVLFLYPGEDVMSDLLYTITEHLRLPNTAKRKADILMYLLCYLATTEHHVGSPDEVEARSLILTNQYICLVSEDVVSYPLPDFVRGLPNTPRYKITDTIKIDSLKRVLFFKDNEHKVTLMYSDEPDEICVDTMSDHFSLENDSSSRQSSPELEVTLLIQCKKEIDKFMMLLKNQWKDLSDNQDLEVHTL